MYFCIGWCEVFGGRFCIVEIKMDVRVNNGHFILVNEIGDVGDLTLAERPV